MLVELCREIVGLKQELETVSQERRKEREDAKETIRELEEHLLMAQEDLQSAQRQMQTREHSLENECAALKMLLQQEQDYWTRFEKSKEVETEKMSQRLAEANAKALQSKERSDSLCREIKLLQSRVDAAVRTSRNFEHRLKLLSHQKHDEQMELEAEVRRLKRKVSEKREQTKYLSAALAAETAAPTITTTRTDTSSSRRTKPTVASLRSPSSISSTSSVFSDPVTVSTFSSRYQPNNNDEREREQDLADHHHRQQRLLRKRDLTLTLPLNNMSKQPAAAAPQHASGDVSSSEDLLSYAPTSPTASSPDMTPPTTPQKNCCTTSTNHLPTHPKVGGGGTKSDRVDRELGDLRRKLNACMQFTLSP